MRTRFSKRLLFKVSLLLLILLLGGLVFSGCRAGLGAVPRGWSGGIIAVSYTHLTLPTTPYV